MRSRIREHRGARVAGGETEPYLPPVPLYMPEAGWAEWLARLSRNVNVLGSAASSGAVGAGDITSVVAGTGLNGGGTTGDVTLNLTVPVSVADGGTGATTPSGALSNLGGISGNQTITLSGDLTGSGTTAINAQIVANAVGTAEIAAANVTYAKIQNTTAARLLGNPTGSAAAPSEITLGTNLSFAGAVLNATGGLSGMTAGQIPIAATATTVTSSGNLSGDITSNSTLVTTLATVNANTGTFQGLTLDAKGRVTAATNQNYVTGGPYLPLTGGTLSGGLTAPSLTSSGGASAVTGITSGGTIGVTGASAALAFQQRDNASVSWLWYATGIFARLWNGADRLWVASNGIFPPTDNTEYCGAGGNSWISVSSYAFNNASDASLKTNVEPLPAVLANVLVLSPKSFTWKAGSDTERTHVGFLAQDVAAAFGEGFGGYVPPEPFTDSDGKERSGDAGLRYHELTAVLWKAVQELTARLEAVEAKLAA